MSNLYSMTSIYLDWKSNKKLGLPEKLKRQLTSANRSNELNKESWSLAATDSKVWTAWWDFLIPVTEVVCITMLKKVAVVTKQVLLSAGARKLESLLSMLGKPMVNIWRAITLGWWVVQKFQLTSKIFDALLYCFDSFKFDSCCWMDFFGKFE